MAKRKAITNKSFAFNKKQIVLAEFANAISHPAKLELISMVSQLGSCSIRDLYEEMPLAASTVAQHLEGLVRGGIVTKKRPPRRSFRYSLNRTEVVKFKKAFNDFFE